MKPSFVRSVNVWIAVLSTLGLVMVSGPAFSQGAGHVYNACSDDAGRLLAGTIKVDEQPACRSRQHVVTWSELGQPGPEGPVGPTGPQGPQGPAGEATRAWSWQTTDTSFVFTVTGFANTSVAVVAVPPGHYIVNFTTAVRNVDGAVGRAAGCFLTMTGGPGTAQPFLTITDISPPNPRATLATTALMKNNHDNNVSIVATCRNLGPGASADAQVSYGPFALNAMKVSCDGGFCFTSPNNE